MICLLLLAAVALFVFWPLFVCARDPRCPGCQTYGVDCIGLCNRPGGSGCPRCGHWCTCGSGPPKTC